MRNVVKQTVFAAGVTQTARRVWHEMITPREIGYSGAGTVLALGADVEGFEIGQTVAYAATGHAELAAPAINHVVAVPDGGRSPPRGVRHRRRHRDAGAARAPICSSARSSAVYGLGLVGPALRRASRSRPAASWSAST